MSNPWLLWKTGMIRRNNIIAVSTVGNTMYLAHDADAATRLWQIRFANERDALVRTELTMSWLKMGEKDTEDLDLVEDVD